MAGIAHPYEETVGTAAEATEAVVAMPAKPREKVSFSDLVDAWTVRESSTEAERRYLERRAAFEATHGEITDGYICEDGRDGDRPHQASRRAGSRSTSSSAGADRALHRNRAARPRPSRGGATRSIAPRCGTSPSGRPCAGSASGCS